MTLQLLFDDNGLACVEITTSESERDAAHAVWRSIADDARKLGEAVQAAVHACPAEET